MSIRTRWMNGLLAWYESTTDETVMVTAPFWYKDDFINNATVAADLVWEIRDTNAATEVLAADAASGVVEMALTSANEVQLAGIDWGDQRTLVLNQGLIIEVRFRLTVLPTGSVVAAVGLCGDHNAAVNSVAESIWARLDGSGAITVETDDTVHETSQVATGVTVIANQWVVLRIDCTTISSVKFYIDGLRKASGTTFDMSQVSTLKLQPVCRIGKEGAATTVGTLQVDYVTAWQNRA